MNARLQTFVDEVERALASADEEARLLEQVGCAMGVLVTVDDWLEPAFALARPDRYQQYLLHCDARRRFCVVSFVWGPGQRTPVHDHTVWGVIGMLRGAEISQGYGHVGDRLVPVRGAVRLAPGDVMAVSPRIGDIHRVSNAHDGRTSISIHAYGADIGTRRRHVYDPETGQAKDFVSRYANEAEASP